MSSAIDYLKRHHVALLALFVALGGTAYAGAKIKAGDLARNSVTSKAIKANAVGNSEVANGAVGSDEIANGSVGGADTACPAGMQRGADVCFQASPQAAAGWDLAVADCAAEGLRMPTLDEALAVATAMPAGAAQLWTSITVDTFVGVPGGLGQTLFVAKSGGGAVSFGLDDGDNPRAYRCVSSPGA